MINIDKWLEEVPDSKIKGCARYEPKYDMSCRHYNRLRCALTMIGCAHDDENEQFKLSYKKNGGYY